MDDAISLGVGEPDFTTPWAIREAGIYSLEKGQTHYTANAGLMELREEICNYYDRKFDIKYNPKKEVLVTVGGSEAIDLMVRTLINPGDEVLIPEPCFVCYRPCTVMQAVFLFRLKQKKRTISDFCRNTERKDYRQDKTFNSAVSEQSDRRNYVKGRFGGYCGGTSRYKYNGTVRRDLC